MISAVRAGRWFGFREGLLWYSRSVNFVSFFTRLPRAAFFVVDHWSSFHLLLRPAGPGGFPGAGFALFRGELLGGCLAAHARHFRDGHGAFASPFRFLFGSHTWDSYRNARLCASVEIVNIVDMLVLDFDAHRRA
jgi:hypothetical protein